MKRLCLVFALFACLALPVFAEGDSSEVSSDDTGLLDLIQEVNDYVSGSPSFSASSEHSAESPESTVPQVTPTPVPAPAEAPALLADVPYEGTISDSILAYFEGMAVQQAGDPYLLYRVDRYNYRYYYGANLVYSSGSFSGSGVSYVNYNSYDGDFSRGSGNVDLVPGSYAIYTNMDEAYSSFPAERIVFYEKALLFSLAVLFVFAVLRLIFFRRSC